jgi:hypothetical protein
VAYEERGGANTLSPIAYLAQGDVLLPAGCAHYWTNGSPQSSPSHFRVAAVFSTGVGDERSFGGEVVTRTAADAPAGRNPSNRAECALRSGAAGASPTSLAGGLLAALAAQPRRAR